MSGINELYADPQYFFCDTRAKEVHLDWCLERLEASHSFPVCERCEQGTRNRLLSKAWPDGHPNRGKGQRDSECKAYAVCLDIAVKSGWRSWNCDSCAYYTLSIRKTMRSEEKPKNTRICEQCGEKPTFGRSPYCASCMATRSNKARKGKKDKKPQPPKHRKKAGPSKPKPEKSPPRGSEAVITINFGKYASILKKVETLAEEEVRSVEGEVIYLLKTSLGESRGITQISHD